MTTVDLARVAALLPVVEREIEASGLLDTTPVVKNPPGSVTVQVMRGTPVVAYMRVSSAGQIDAWGLDRQEAAIRQYARTHGLKITAWHRDEGRSGTLDVIDRPGLEAAIAEIGHGADAILIADLDRFARKLTVQEAALAVVWRAGGRVLTATSGEVHAEDPEDPSRNLIRQVMGAVIEYEKNTAVKRMRDGMRAKAATGRKATGSYAYGYQATGKGRARDAGPRADEQAAVARVVELRGEGASYREIAATLDAEGHRPRRAASWSAMAVRAVAQRAMGPAAAAGARVEG